MKIVTINHFLPLLLITVVTGCTSLPTAQIKSSKIKFDTDSINTLGLRGVPTSLRSVSYEFCIPNNDVMAKQVRAIDSSAQLHKQARGRINCSASEILTIGNTQQAQWQSVLLDLSALEYIVEIRETFFE
jgi:hypothetical protein